MTKEKVIKYLNVFDYDAIQSDESKITFEREYVGRYHSTTLRVEINTWFELDAEEERYILTDYTEEFRYNDIRLDDALDVDDYSDLLRIIYDEIREIEDKFDKEV